ncbi:hypothetical protein KL949_005104 [Ogataea haglerorum]|nr:hypothetical protein KL913_005066 [Ogataea haglerorum]KAG7713941.1 hypothetical protein KL949_005104 [Ogataea haglerorum]
MSLVSAIAFHGDEVAAEAQNRDPCLAGTKLLITDPAAWKSQTRDECLVVQMSAGSRAVHKGAVNGQRRACSPSVAAEEQLRWSAIEFASRIQSQSICPQSISDTEC